MNTRRRLPARAAPPLRTLRTRRTTRALLPLLAAGLSLGGLAGAASAQTAADVLAEAREAWERRVEGIESYTVVQKVMGTETTVHMVRDEVDGMVIFRPRNVSPTAGGEPDDRPLDQAFFLRADVAERMTYEGTDEVEGHACHLLTLEDFEGLDIENAVPGGSGSVEVESMRMCLDARSHVLRRVEMEGTTDAGGQSRPFGNVVVLGDYRDVQGLLHPFHVEMTLTGLAPTGAEQGEMAEAMARLEEQLEQLPEEQRERMRAMLESQLGAMEGLMGAAQGEPIVVETVEVRVNEGPPTGGR